MKQFLKRLIIVGPVAGLVLYPLFAFVALQMNPLKWDDSTRALFIMFLVVVGGFIYLDIVVKESNKKEN